MSKRSGLKGLSLKEWKHPKMQRPRLFHLTMELVEKNQDVEPIKETVDNSKFNADIKIETNIDFSF